MLSRLTLSTCRPSGLKHALSTGDRCRMGGTEGQTHPGPDQRFTQSGHIRVVVHEDLRSRLRLQPIRQGKPRPTRELMGAIDLTLPPVRRSAEADADGFDFPIRHQLGNRPLDLAPDTFSAVGGRHREPAPRVNLAGRVTEDELQFGAADFNAEQ